jgi:hypothetical protein
MGLTAGIIAIATVAVSAAAMLFYRPQTANVNQDDMSPANLDSFSVTSASEGSCVAKCYGRVRLAGNIIWWGNLRSEAVYEEVETGGGKGGGGGGGSEDVLQGYNYYIDMWQAVCCGPATLEKVYINDTETSLSSRCRSYHWNDGTGSYYPTAPGQYASSLPGIAHIYIEKFFVGFNVTSVPTLHFVVNSVPDDIPFSNVSLENGINPAAICYDVLRMAGATLSNINLSTFSAAATYWKNAGYGLNFSITKKQEAKKIIEQVLGYVGGSFYEMTDGTFSIKADDPDEQAVASIVDETECTDLVIKRKTWDDTYNSFTGKYQSADMSETMRVVVAKNPASISLMGRTVSRSVDLTGFRDQASASKRLWEIMKRESYPIAEMECTCFLKHIGIGVGDIVKITSARYGVTDLEFRITTKDISQIDSNSVKFQGEQVTSRLYTSTFDPPQTGPVWVPPDNAPQPIDQTLRLYELPKNPYTEEQSALLVLAARSGQEDGIKVFKSNDGSDYYYLTKITAWAQKGTLVEDYPSDTLAIDDDIGILYATEREDPIFLSYSRADLFGRTRLALIDDELVGFQIVELEGESDIRLTGVVRGLFNTPVQEHTAGATIWLSDIGNAILSFDDASEVWLKFLPAFSTQSVELDEVAAHHIIFDAYAKKPWQVTGIRAERSGSTVTVSWMPCDIGHGGAGIINADACTDQYPFEFDGDFVVNGETVAATTYTIETASAITVEIKARENGQLSDARTVYVGTEDGIYYA